METEKKKEPGYPLGKTILRMLKNMWRMDKGLYLNLFVYTVAGGIYPFLSVLLVRLLLGELEKGGSAQPQNILFIAAAFAVAAGALGFTKYYLHGASYMRLCMLRMDYCCDINKKQMEMAYPNVEDPLFKQTWQKSLSACNGNRMGLEQIYHMLFEAPAVGLTVLIMTVTVGSLSPLVLAGLLLHLAAVLLVSSKAQQYRFSKKEETAAWERRENYYQNTTSDFTFGKDIRMYGLRQRIHDNCSAQIEGCRGVQKLIAGREYLWGFLSLGTLLLSDLLTYGILIGRTLRGMSIADFSMYLAAVLSLSSNLKTLSEQIGEIITEGQYAHEMYRFLDEDMGEKGGDVPAVTDDTLEIVFDDVSFKYPRSGTWIFRHLNLTIHKGERLAVVGVNGAGKSTLVKLMMGLFDVTEGQIRINGVDVRRYDKRALYSMFSAAFQEVNLLAFSVKENVAGTDAGIDEARVNEVIERVGLRDKIESLPDGTDNMVLKVIDENGAMFSGGEAQKLTIARALYKDACMVVMDEPTAALDALAEAEIYENFSALVKGKTALYISHRLASTRFCDHIAFFDGDGLKEYGTHEELMEKRGAYYEMFTVQGKYYTGREGEVA